MAIQMCAGQQAPVPARYASPAYSCIAIGCEIGTNGIVAMYYMPRAPEPSVQLVKGGPNSV